METNIENPTPETGSEEEVKTEVLEEVSPEELEFATTDELIEKYKKAVDSNKQLHARLAKQKAAAEKKEQPKETNNTPQGKLSLDDKVELRLQGYSAEEVAYLERNGGMDALKDEFVMSGIEAQRAKRKSAEATPEGSPKSPVYKKYTQGDLAKMSLEQLEKIVPRDDD